MDVQVTRIRPRRGGRASVSVRLVVRGRAPLVIEVETPELLGAPVQNQSGFCRTTDGRWIFPGSRRPDGSWDRRLNPDIDWERQPVTDEHYRDLVMGSREMRPHRHQNVVAACAQDGFGEYTNNEFRIRVVPLTPVYIDPVTGMVELRVQAFDSVSGAALYVEDGTFQFDRVPMSLNGADDPAGRLRLELARIIRGMQP